MATKKTNQDLISSADWYIAMLGGPITDGDRAEVRQFIVKVRKHLETCATEVAP